MKTNLVLLGKRINVASQSRRRLLVVLLYIGFGMLVIAGSSFLGKLPWGLLLAFAFLRAARFLGGRNYEDGLIPPVDSGDERELHRRDRAYFLSYWWWDLTLIPALLATGFRINPMPSTWNPEVRAVLYQLPVWLLAASGILYYTLPQAILLWTEPDMEDFS
jgi:hypothetical protein